MTRMLVIRLEIPDGVGVAIGTSDEDDELPPPWEPPEALVPQRPHPLPSGTCPVHRVPWRLVPAGISKRTGHPYAAFETCAVQGCDRKPSPAPRAAS